MARRKITDEVRALAGLVLSGDDSRFFSSTLKLSHWRGECLRVNWTRRDEGGAIVATDLGRELVEKGFV